MKLVFLLTDHIKNMFREKNRDWTFVMLSFMAKCGQNLTKTKGKCLGKRKSSVVSEPTVFFCCIQQFANCVTLRKKNNTHKYNTFFSFFRCVLDLSFETIQKKTSFLYRRVIMAARLKATKSKLSERNPQLKCPNE